MKNVVNSDVKDRSLAPNGQLKIDWVQENMPVLNRIRRKFEQEKPFAGL